MMSMPATLPTLLTGSATATSLLHPCSIPADSSHLAAARFTCHADHFNKLSRPKHLSNAVLHCRSFSIPLAGQITSHTIHSPYIINAIVHCCILHRSVTTIPPFAADLRPSLPQPLITRSERAKPSWGASPANLGTFIEASVHLCEQRRLPPATVAPNASAAVGRAVSPYPCAVNDRFPGKKRENTLCLSSYAPVRLPAIYRATFGETTHSTRRPTPPPPPSALSSRETDVREGPTRSSAIRQPCRPHDTAPSTTFAEIRVARTRRCRSATCSRSRLHGEGMDMEGAS